MSRRPPVTTTRLPAEGALHPAGCRCAEDDCVGRSVQLDATALAPGPALARAIRRDAAAVYARPLPVAESDATALLRGPDDAARKAGAR